MTVAEMRKSLGMSRAKFGRQYNIPIRTLESWEAGVRTPPEYVMSLLERCVMEDVNALESDTTIQTIDTQIEQAKHPEDLTEQGIIDNRFL